MRTGDIELPKREETVVRKHMDSTQISFSHVSKTTQRNANFRNGTDYSVRYMIILYKIYSTQQNSTIPNTLLSLKDTVAPVRASKAEGG
jgi:hypothetical protein